MHGCHVLVNDPFPANMNTVQLPHLLRRFKVEKLDPLCETAKTLISEYKDLLIRVNLAK